MKRATQLGALCSFWIVAATGCHPGNPLEVQYSSPKGELQTVPLWIEVRFDHPIVDPSAPDPAPRGLELAVEPPIAGQIRFPTPNTLQYHFAEKVPPAQSYRVTIGSGLSSTDGQYVLEDDHTFTFTSETNSITDLWRLPPAAKDPSSEPFPEKGERVVKNMDLHDRLLVNLRYPEKVERLERLLSVSGRSMAGGDLEPMDVDLAFADENPTARILITPKPNWPKHTDLSVQIAAGLAVASEPAGPVTTREMMSRGAATYGPIEIISGPQCSGCKAPPVFKLEFSTPVVCEDVRRFVAVSSVEEVRCAGQPRPTVVRLEPVPAFADHTTYTITVRPGVPDGFGQRLNETRRFVLQTGSGTTRFAYQKMFNILERKQGGAHEEKVFKTAKLKVEGARLPFADAWKILQEEQLDDQVAWRDLPWWLSESYYYYDSPCYWDEGSGEEICEDESDRRDPGETLGDEVAIPNAVVEEIEVPSREGWAVAQVPLSPYLRGKGGLVLLKVTPFAKSGARISSPVLRLLNVTDIGLSAKYSPSQLVVLAARLSDGRAISGAEVRVFAGPGDDAEPAVTGTTDDTGVAVFSAAELAHQGQNPNLHRRPLLVVASHEDDEAFIWSKFRAGGQEARSDGPTLVGAVYAERGVYRPGETAYFRVVARTQTAGGFATPAGRVEIVVKRGLYGDDDEAIYQTEMELSAYGTVHGSFVIPIDARVGDYRIVAKTADRSIQGEIKVAELRRAEMKVAVHTDRNDYIAGQQLTVRVNADYLFGAPAAGLDMRWSLRRNWGYYSSQRFPQARFTDYSYHSWYDEQEPYSEFVDEDTVALDDTGSFTMTRKLKTPGNRGRTENLIVSATVDDESGQSVSARRTVHVHPADFHVGLIPRGYLKEKDQLFTYEVVAVSPDDEPVAGVEAAVSMVQDYWYSVKRQGPGGRIYWDHKREEIKKENVCTGKTDTNGRLTCQYTPEKGGGLRLRVEAKDEKGRVVRASSWFWVIGDPDYYGGRSNQSNQVSLMSEAPEVDAGKPTRVALTSPFPEALALVTVEREDILWQQVMAIGSNGAVELPVSPSWAPNVYVSATVVRGRVTPQGELKPDPERDKPAFALGYLNLKVRPTQNLLSVTVQADRGKYEPGDEVVAKVEVKDYTGQPARAEVNLFAVDEGVLTLTAYKTPDLVPKLFQSRPYTVLAMDTRMHVLGQRKFITPVIKGEEDGGGGGEGDDEEVREDFDPVAVWVGSLVTDTAGGARYAFRVPDTLTTYRLMAVAVTEKDRFGSGDSGFIVQKTLMMRQAMSRFARPGDRLDAGVVVNQLSGKNERVEVELAAIDDRLFTVKGERKLTKEVGAQQTVAFRFDIEANDVEGESEIVFSARMGDKRDKVRLILPVKRLQARESIGVAGVLEKGEITHTLTLPEMTRAQSLDLSLSALPVASIEERMRALVGYPYGCLEQRTSKIMPLIAIRELSEKLNFTSIPTAKIEEWVDEYIGLVPKYRCKDDGYDYYPGCGGGSQPYLTAFALEGLLTAKRFGYRVPDELLDRPAGYLEEQLATLDREGDKARLTGALRVLAMLKRSKPALENVIFDARADLPTFAKTDLIRAIFTRTQKKDERITTLLADFDSLGVRSNGSMTFRAADQARYWWAWDSDLRTTAVVLRTLLEVEPADARVPLIIKGLVNLDGEQAYYVTQGVTQTLLALAEAVEVLQSEGRKPKATVKVNNEVLFEDWTINETMESKKLAGRDLGAGPYTVSLANRGDGPLFFGGFLSYAYPATARLPAKSSGFRVEREYTDRNGKAVGDRVEVGDYVMVNLRIWVEEDGRMVIVDDPLPAGLEPVDTSLATSDTEIAAVMEGKSRDWSWWRSRYRELRDDRCEWHFRRLWRTDSAKHPLELRYLTKATTPGSYYAPGTTVERMYQPEIRGRAAGREVIVEPKR